MYISTYIITIVRKLDEPRTKVFKLILSETRKEISSFDRLVHVYYDKTSVYYEYL